jgi:hypothetical protein
VRIGAYGDLSALCSVIIRDDYDAGIITNPEYGVIKWGGKYLRDQIIRHATSAPMTQYDPLIMGEGNGADQTFQIG